jgi:exopolyphosphatase / guanosine-5'-triphosphate,3'-diphosphate pyrophosphatase
LKLAVIDIGSNAIRLQVSKVINYQGKTNFKKIEYVRFPLRLGQDVFSIKKISHESEAKFIKLMKAFQMLIELYEIDDYLICATSAMRESKNGHDIAQRVIEETGLRINIIDGNKEAEIINKALLRHLDEKTYLHIDVGGGSTELNLYVNKEKITAKSFKIGSVRRLKTSDSPESWNKMKVWVEENIKKNYGKVTAIGTGGNIGKIYEMGRSKGRKLLPIDKMQSVIEHISSYSLEERVNILQFNPDRADVIVPASEIYLSVMQWAKAKHILVPDVGLKDGMLELLYEKNCKKAEKINMEQLP